MEDTLVKKGITGRMTGTDQYSTSTGFPGPFENPLKDWPNSDLLIDKEDREFFDRNYPEFAPIFDWPELRSLFVEYNTTAASSRTHSRRAGVIAVLCGFLSLCVAAAAPMATELSHGSPAQSLQTQAALGGIAAVLAVVSIIIGYTQILRGKEKARWLTNRFWTERTRQFHFQLILNCLPLVIAAVGEEDGLEKWREFRARELDRFKHEYLHGMVDKIIHLEEDDAEDRPWISEDWEYPGPIPPASPKFDLLLKLLEQQRFGIQHRYAKRKLTHGWHSPETRAQWVLKLSDTLTAVLLVATIVVGLFSLAALRFDANAKWILIAGCSGAISSSAIIAMRALKEGLLFSADAERYRWYLAAVDSLHHRFEHADSHQRVGLLRQLELITYQEMRRFILSASNARFVM